jgi:pyroglutamyl-peptidase
LTILVFGFEPFLEFDENPSGLVAKHLEYKNNLNGQEVVARILHVDYSMIEREIVSAIDSTNPSLVVGFGLAASRTKYTPEKIAINYRYTHAADKTGKSMNGVPIDEKASDGIFTNLPVEGLVEHLNQSGIPSDISTTAGGYLCNNAMFVIVREARKRGFGGGFIHIPCHSEWVAKNNNKVFPSLPIETMYKASELSLGYFLKHSRVPLLQQQAVSSKF